MSRQSRTSELQDVNIPKSGCMFKHELKSTTSSIFSMRLSWGCGDDATSSACSCFPCASHPWKAPVQLSTTLGALNSSIQPFIEILNSKFQNLQGRHPLSSTFVVERPGFKEIKAVPVHVEFSTGTALY